MKVILKSSIDNLGRAGDVKEVRTGYGRNFLIPQGKAVLATPEAITAWERGREKRAKLVDKKVSEARVLAEKLAGVTLSFARPVSAEGRLFGSVGKSDVIKSLKASGHEVDKSAVVLDAAIKQIGEHEVELKLDQEVSIKIKVTVVPRE